MESTDNRVRETWLIVVARRTGGSLAHLRKVYGSDVQVSRLAGHNLIHLDRPDTKELQRRIASLSQGSLPLPAEVTADHLSAGLDIIFLRRRSDAPGPRNGTDRPELDGTRSRPGS